MKIKLLILIAILILAGILRLYALENNPSGFNADEAAIGYNAYSLIETGKDEHGLSWPLVFRSFGDYKPGGYFYLVLPFVKILGPSVLAVRLPSALLGIVSVWLIYLLAGELAAVSQLISQKTKFQLYSALLLAASPWHLQFSRGGWETNAATAMLLGSIYFFLKSLNRQIYLLPASFLLILSMYTYQSTRLIAPLLGIALCLIFWKKFWPPTKTLFAAAAISFILLVPLGQVILSPSGLSRLSGVGLSADLGPINRVNQLRGQHENPAGLTAKLKHNKIAAYLFLLGKNYLDHFGGNFLFISGDPIQRNKVPEMGQLYLMELPFILFGVWILAKKGGKSSQVIFSWLLIAPVAAAFTFQTPHALRSLNMVIPMVLIASLGLASGTKLLKDLGRPLLFTLFSILLSLGYLWNFSKYLNQYYIHYPQTFPSAWEFGFGEVADKLKPLISKYDRIIVTDTYDQPYIELLFFLKYPPQTFQKEVVLTPRDNFGFSTVRQFGKFVFAPVVWDEVKTIPGTLVIGTQKDIPPSANIIDQVSFPDGQPAFVFADTST